MKKISKKILACVVSASMIFSSMFVASFADTSKTNLSATSSATSVAIGDEFTVTLSVNDLSCCSFAGGIEFNKEVVKFKKAEGVDGVENEFYLSYKNPGKNKGIFLDGEKGTENNTFGLYYVGSKETEYEAGLLAKITFEAIGAGNANIELYEDSDGTTKYKGEGIDPGFEVKSVNELKSIEIKSAPNKTVYCEGQSFDSTGMVVTAKYADNTTKDLTNGFTVSPSGKLEVGTTSVNVSYKDGNITKTVAQSITVNKHKYEVKEWKWNAYESATLGLECSECKNKISESAKITSKETKDATCTEVGKTEYTATVVKEDKTYTDKKIDDTKPEALGHDYTNVTPTWVWNEDLTEATATFECKRSGCSHTESVKATKAGGQITVENTTLAKCEKAGLDTYTAKVKFNDKEYSTTKTKDVAALDHDYTDVTPTWSWNNDCTEATAKFKCKRSGCSHEETVKATENSGITVKHTTPAECEKAGLDTYTAVVTFNGKEYSATTTKEVKALGHDYAGAKTEWAWEGYTKATAKVKCQREGCDHEESGSTTSITNAVTTKATCEAAGVTTYTAKVTLGGKEFTGTKLDESKPVALGHDYQPTWKWADDYSSASLDMACTRCDSKISSIPAEVTSKVTEAPTCTKAGKTEYTATVKQDGKTYTDTKVDEKKPEALDHDYTEVTPTWSWNSDCTEAIAKFKCKRNGCSHEESVKATKAGGQITVEHTTLAECEKAGLDTYTAKVTFNGKEYSATTTKEVKALGHDYAGAKAEWAWEGYTKATAKVKCQREGCDHEETGSTTSITNAITTKATCEAAGVTTYTAKVTLGGTEFTGTKLDESKPEALGHDYQLTWNWADDYTSATLDMACTRCESKISSLTAEVTSREIAAATCTKAGKTEYTATVKQDGKTYTDTKVDETKPAALGHSMDYTKARSATCTEPGNTEYWYCSVCKKYFADEKGNTEIKENSWVVNPLGHKWKVDHIDKDAGTIYLVCEHDATHSKTEPYSEDEDHDVKVIVKKDYDITEDLIESGMITPEDITEKLGDNVIKQKGFENAKTSFVDIELYVKIGDSWVVADENLIPKEGLIVTVPYPEGMDQTYNFIVGHMFAKNMIGADGVQHNAGEVEIIKDITKGSDGITFRVYSLSPFEIAGVPSEENKSGVTTGDTNNLYTYVLMMLMTVVATGILVYKRKRG